MISGEDQGIDPLPFSINGESKIMKHMFFLSASTNGGSTSKIGIIFAVNIDHAVELVTARICDRASITIKDQNAILNCDHGTVEIIDLGTYNMPPIMARDRSALDH